MTDNRPSPFTPAQALAVALYNAGIKTRSTREDLDNWMALGMPIEEAKETLRLIEGMGWKLVER